MQPNLSQPEHGESMFELFCAPVGSCLYTNDIKWQKNQERGQATI